MEASIGTVHKTANISDDNGPTVGRLRSLVQYDGTTGVFRWKISSGNSRKGAVAGGRIGNGYLVISIDGRAYPAHRLAWLYSTGDWPPQEIDHINGNRADNRITNLRKCSRMENSWNSGKRSQNKSGYKGVHQISGSGKWKATIRAAGKITHIGLFDTAIEAARAYDEVAKTLHGKFAKLNNA